MDIVKCVKTKLSKTSDLQASGKGALPEKVPCSRILGLTHKNSVQPLPHKRRRTWAIGCSHSLVARTIALLTGCHYPHSAWAQTDHTPLDAAKVLADLAKLEQTTHTQTEATRRREALAALQQAAGSGSAATRLYETAVEGTGQTGMADWKKKNADLLRSKIFQEAVQLHLRYLVL
jgi:hypothetical protein